MKRIKNTAVIKTLTIAVIGALLISSFGLAASAATVDDDELGVYSPSDGAVAAQAESYEIADGEFPSYYSSRDSGYVSSVKKQQYNDCWVYGGLGTVESFYMKNGIYTEDMSTTHANLWATTREGNKGWLRQYYDAGRAKMMPGYLTSWQGAVAQSKALNLSFDGSITPELLATDLADYGITAIKYLQKGDVYGIKQALMESGGISTYFSHTPNCLANDDISYYMPSSYSGSYTGHAIEVVGWDDNYSADKFRTKPSRNGAWQCKNSWGTTRNDGGYFWISYDDFGLFHNTRYKPSFQIKSYESTADKKLMQNEIFGATYEFGYVKQRQVTFINNFRFEKGYRVLDKVIFETECQGADYTIYYVPDMNGEPIANESAWTELYSSTTDYAGYICADFEDFEIPDDSGSIAVKIDGTPVSQNAILGVCEWLNLSDGSYSFLNDSKYGDSYIKYNGVMTDLMDWYKTNNNDDLGGTFVIKALTKKSPIKQGDINLDGVIDVSDAYLLQKHVALLIELDEESLAVADMNSDGVYTVSDVTIIQRIAAGQI